MLVCLLVGMATVPLAGGTLHRLDDPGFRAGWLLALALGLQLAVTTVWEPPPTLAASLHAASYVVGAAWLVANRRVRGMPLLALGGVANGAAILANGGVMPASDWALRTSGLEHAAGEFSNSGSVEGARLAWLGDVFATPASWPLANVFSVGDVLLVLGGLLVLHAAAGSRWTRRSGAAGLRPAAAGPSAAG